MGTKQKIPRGRNGGRPTSVGATARATITLTPADLAYLHSIAPKTSEAVRLLIAKDRQRILTHNSTDPSSHHSGQAQTGEA